MLKLDRGLATRNTTQHLKINDVTGKFPGLMGVSNNTHDLIDSCVFMAERVIGDITKDMHKGKMQTPNTYLDKVGTLGVNAGAFTLSILPELSERIAGHQVETTRCLFHPSDGETADLTLEVKTKVVEDIPPNSKSAIRLMVQANVDNYVFNKVFGSSE